MERHIVAQADELVRVIVHLVHDVVGEGDERGVNRAALADDRVVQLGGCILQLEVNLKRRDHDRERDQTRCTNLAASTPSLFTHVDGKHCQR